MPAAVDSLLVWGVGHISWPRSIQKGPLSLPR